MTLPSRSSKASKVALPIAMTTPMTLAKASTRKPLVFCLVATMFLGSLLWHRLDWISQVRLSTIQIDDDNTSIPLGHLTIANDTNAHAFHLLIPASEPNPNLCKTIFSLTALQYPPPVLLNYGRKTTDANNSYMAKMEAVSRWLQESQDLRDKDMVLMVDADNVWFQLPPSILLGRFKALTEQKSENLRARYGTHKVGGEESRRVGHYTEKIVFGNDKLCPSNVDQEHNLACSAIPESTLPEDSWGLETDKDSSGYHNRPKFLNPNTIMGRTSDLKELYKYAMTKAKNGKGNLDDQHILAEIFGEQEYQRELSRQNRSSPWLSWLGEKLGSSKVPNITNLHMKAVPGQNYEFGIGIDYSSRLFFTMAHSEQDVEWVQFNDSASLATLQEHYGIPHPKSIVMPLDLQRAKSPFYQKSAGTESDASYELSQQGLPDSATLDWSNLPLAINIHSRKVSPILHFNDEKSYRSSWWARMWYHPWARPLLRMGADEPPTLLYKDRTAFLTGSKPESFWNAAGGAAGAWTDDGKWLSWNQLCEKHEDEIFA